MSIADLKALLTSHNRDVTESYTIILDDEHQSAVVDAHNKWVEAQNVGPTKQGMSVDRSHIDAAHAAFKAAWEAVPDDVCARLVFGMHPGGNDGYWELYDRHNTAGGEDVDNKFFRALAGECFRHAETVHSDDTPPEKIPGLAWADIDCLSDQDLLNVGYLCVSLHRKGRGLPFDPASFGESQPS